MVYWLISPLNISLVVVSAWLVLGIFMGGVLCGKDADWPSILAGFTWMIICFGSSMAAMYHLVCAIRQNIVSKTYDFRPMKNLDVKAHILLSNWVLGTTINTRAVKKVSNGSN